MSGTTTWDLSETNALVEEVKSFKPSNNPQGYGRITCPVSKPVRKVDLTTDDYAIRAGHADGSSHYKTVYGGYMASKLKISCGQACGRIFRRWICHHHEESRLVLSTSIDELPTDHCPHQRGFPEYGRCHWSRNRFRSRPRSLDTFLRHGCSCW